MDERGVVVLVLVIVRPVRELAEWAPGVVVRDVVMVVGMDLTGMGVFVLLVADDLLFDPRAALLDHLGLLACSSSHQRMSATVPHQRGTGFAADES
jgi:hypothetical protein